MIEALCFWPRAVSSCRRKGGAELLCAFLFGRWSWPLDHQRSRDTLHKTRKKAVGLDSVPTLMASGLLERENERQGRSFLVTLCVCKLF